MRRTATTSCLIWLSLWAVCFGDAKAIIDGPTQAKAGDLVVLNGDASTGAGFAWRTPPDLQTLQCGNGLQLAFASGTPGRYTFTLIAADERAKIHFVDHVVEIVGQLPTDPKPDPKPDPDKPTDPKPDPDKPTPPPGKMEELRKLSAEKSAALRDPETSAGLAESIRIAAGSIEGMCERGVCPGLAEAKRLMVMAIETRLLARSGRSLSVNWLDGWRRPMDAALKSTELTTVEEYLLAMRALATGLEAGN